MRTIEKTLDEKLGTIKFSDELKNIKPRKSFKKEEFFRLAKEVKDIFENERKRTLTETPTEYPT